MSVFLEMGILRKKWVRVRFGFDKIKVRFGSSSVRFHQMRVRVRFGSEHHFKTRVRVRYDQSSGSVRVRFFTLDRQTHQGIILTFTSFYYVANVATRIAIFYFVSLLLFYSADGERLQISKNSLFLKCFIF